MAKIQSSVPVSVLHNDLHGLNLGDYLHLTAAEKAKFDNLNDLMHTIGNESFTGIKSSINTGASQINGFILTNNGTGFNSQVIRVNNNSTGLGLLTDNQGTGYGIYANNGGLGYGIASYNYSNGIGIQNYNQTGGIGLVLDASPIATNYLFQGRSNGTPTSSLTKAGDFTANSFIKSGGTSSQFLKADGSVDTNTYLLSSDNYWTKTGVDLQNNNTGHVQVKLQSGKQFQVLNSSGVIQTYIDDIGNARFGNTTQYTQVGISSNIHLRLIRAQATVDFINGNPGISQAFAITTTNTYGMNYQTGSGSVSSSEHFFTIGGVSGSSVLSDGIFRISTSRLLSTVPSKYATDLSASYDDRTLIDKGYLDSRITGISTFVPYTGANANVNLGEYGLSAGNIQFDLTPTQPLSVGQLRWNDIDGTLEFLMKGGNVTQQIGQELPILVKHADNTGLTNGFVVYTVGSDGNNNTVRYAIATSDLTSSTTFGVMTEDAIGGAKAFCTTFGMVRGINTLALVEGSAVWLSATVAGGLTTTKPIAPNHSVYIGVCVRSHATEGAIFVNISNGYELGELHNVLTTNPLNNEGLFFDSATNLWKNESITSALGYTPYNATNPSGYTTNLGTVTSVAALTLGTTGTDLNSSVSNGTTTPVITLNVPTASASNRGALSPSDWINFNSAYNNSITNLTIDYGAFVTNLILTKQNSSTIELGLIAGSATLGDIVQFNGTNLTYVPTIVSAPLSYIPNSNSFSISQANTSTNGYISSSDWNLFNNKQSALSGTGFVKSTAGVISYDTSTYLTSISGITAGGELSGTYPNPTLLNSAVIGKVLTGVNITGGSVSATDSILTAFGKLQNQVNSLLGGSIYQSVWNASTNSPTLTSSVGTKGYYYIVSVAGTTNLNGITDWKVGDWAIYDGTSWQKVDNTDAVSSVNGFTGSVSLTTANITENTNLYYTDVRSRNAISLTNTGNSGASSYSSATGIFNIPTYTLAGLGGQPLNSNLTSVSSLSYVSPAFVKMTGVDTFALDTTVYENIANKSDSYTVSSSTTYASTKALVDGLATKANDANAVHLAGTETITGTKTFSVSPLFDLGARYKTPTLGFQSINAFDTGWGFGVGAVTQSFLFSGATGYNYTFPNADGTLALTSNLSAYQPLLTNPITGTGTTNTIPKFTGVNALGNSGIIDNGATVNFSTSNVRITGADATTRFSIGNSSSTAYIDFYGQTHATIPNDIALITNSAGRVRFFTTATERATILANGNFLIGTTTDNGNKLRVIGNTEINGVVKTLTSTGEFLRSDASVAGASQTINIYNSAGTRRMLFGYGSTSSESLFLSNDLNGDIIIRTNAVERMRIASNGNVGIGTTNPLSKLDVNGQVRVTDLTLQGFYQARKSDIVSEGVFGGNSFVLRNGSTSEDLNFDIFNRSSSLWYTPMVIKNTGNIGIGTTTPIGKVNIFTGLTGITDFNISSQQSGSISFSNAASTSAVPAIIGKSNDNTGLTLQSATNNTNAGPDMSFVVRENDNTDFATLSTPAFRFSRFATNLVDILRNGNVLIGTTTDAGTDKLQVAGNISNNSQQNIIYSSFNNDAALFQRDGGYGSVIRIGRKGVSTLASIDYPNSGEMGLSTNGAERINIASTGVVKVSNLAGTGTRTVVADASGILSASATSTSTYKVYTALVTQSGTSAPTATVLENTLGGTVVLSRVSAGQYKATLTGAFTANKTTSSCTPGAGTGNNIVTIVAYQSTANEVVFNTATVAGGGFIDGVLSAATFEIRVYN